jgi:hypothetical protein
MRYCWPALMFVVCILSTSEAPAVQKEEGIVKIPSHHSVDETVDKLKAILQSKGVTLFALIDHSGEAEKVGMKMPPTRAPADAAQARALAPGARCLATCRRA